MLISQVLSAADDNMPGPLTVGGLAVVLFGAIGILWRQQKQTQDERITRLQKEADERETQHRKEADERFVEMKNQRDDYKKMLVGDMIDNERFVHRQMRERGIPVVQTIAAVIPEANSPSTEKQIDAAEFATIKARSEELKRSRHKLVNGQEKLVDDAIRLGEGAAELAEQVKNLKQEQIAPETKPSTPSPESAPPGGVVPGNLTAVGIIKGDRGALHPVEIKGKIDPPEKREEK